MNPEAQEILKKILAKEPSELTSDDIAFMKARIDYVGKSSRAKFADVLANETPKPKEPEQTPEAKQEIQAEEGKKNEEVIGTATTTPYDNADAVDEDEDGDDEGVEQTDAVDEEDDTVE